MEIGGFFEFPEYDCPNIKKSVFYALKTSYNIGNYKNIFVRDGRQAIKFVLTLYYNCINNKICYLPSYLCSSILQPFKELGLNVYFYPHSPPLSPKLDDLDIEDSVIFIIDYFGTEQLPNKEIHKIAQNNLIVIIDITHSIFNPNRFKIKDENVFLIASLRKVFPIPDGGIMYYNKKLNINYSFNEPKGYEKMLEAMFLKKFYIKNGLRDNLLKEYFLRLYRDYENLKYNKIKKIERMPEISFHILSNICITKIFYKRKQNLKYLYENLGEFFLFEYRDIVSPFFAPLVFRNSKEREEVKALLISNNIYPPIHWKLPSEIPKVFSYEYELSRRILSIPIDQRYTPENLSIITNLIRGIIHE